MAHRSINVYSTGYWRIFLRMIRPTIKVFCPKQTASILIQSAEYKINARLNTETTGCQLGLSHAFVYHQSHCSPNVLFLDEYATTNISLPASQQQQSAVNCLDRNATLMKINGRRPWTSHLGRSID